MELSKENVVRIVLADDHHVVRSGVRFEIDRQPDMQVVGEAGDGMEAIRMAQQLKPHVLLLDINMPGKTGMEVTDALSNQPHTGAEAAGGDRGPHILILSAYCEPEYVYSLFAAGAKGYLLKDEPPQRIVEGIRQVVAGLPALSLPVQQVLLTRPEVVQHELSARELEVLRLMARGNTNEEIADHLVIAVGTVKNHVANIYRKLPNVRTRSEAVAWAWENRIVRAE